MVINALKESWLFFCGVHNGVYLTENIRAIIGSNSPLTFLI